MAVKQTAGREALGEFAPKFAELNDDVLFGQVWSREDKLSLRDRSIVTVVPSILKYYFYGVSIIVCKSSIHSASSMPSLSDNEYANLPSVQIAKV